MGSLCIVLIVILVDILVIIIVISICAALLSIYMFVCFSCISDLEKGNCIILSVNPRKPKMNATKLV